MEGLSSRGAGRWSVERHELTLPLRVVDAEEVEPFWPVATLAKAEVDDRNKDAFSGERHRRFDTAQQTGADATRAGRKRPDVVPSQANLRLPETAMGRAIPRDHSSGLAAAHDHGAPSDEREDRWKLEVVIADVVRRHLNGPTEAACPPREDDKGVRVLDVAGVVATVRTLRVPPQG